MERYRWDFAVMLHVSPRELDTLTLYEFEHGRATIDAMHRANAQAQARLDATGG